MYSSDPVFGNDVPMPNSVTIWLEPWINIDHAYGYSAEEKKMVNPIALGMRKFRKKVRVWSDLFLGRMSLQHPWRLEQ